VDIQILRRRFPLQHDARLHSSNNVTSTTRPIAQRGRCNGGTRVARTDVRWREAEGRPSQRAVTG
jgi:hypothetical protein